MELPTVTITTPNGPVVINATDFDPEVHELFEAQPKPPKRTPRGKRRSADDQN